jgi:hypothetical protein
MQAALQGGEPEARERCGTCAWETASHHEARRPWLPYLSIDGVFLNRYIFFVFLFSSIYFVRCESLLRRACVHQIQLVSGQWPSRGSHWTMLRFASFAGKPRLCSCLVAGRLTLDSIGQRRQP